MARKTTADIKGGRIAAALEQYELVTEVKHEVALETFETQDAKTRKLIERIADVLRTYATGSVTLEGEDVVLTEECLTQSLLVLAVEVAKDLALLDIQVGEFAFPQGQCVKCGIEL
jgi:hypothetical protein